MARYDAQMDPREKAFLAATRKKEQELSILQMRERDRKRKFCRARESSFDEGRGSPPQRKSALDDED